jgi:hypothetical protein
MPLSSHEGQSQGYGNDVELVLSAIGTKEYGDL